MEPPAWDEPRYTVGICLDALDVQFQGHIGWPQVCRVDSCGMDGDLNPPPPIQPNRTLQPLLVIV